MYPPSQVMGGETDIMKSNGWGLLRGSGELSLRMGPIEGVWRVKLNRCGPLRGSGALAGGRPVRKSRNREPPQSLKGAQGIMGSWGRERHCSRGFSNIVKTNPGRLNCSLAHRISEASLIGHYWTGSFVFIASSCAANGPR